jgi:hypothetical protein
MLITSAINVARRGRGVKLTNHGNTFHEVEGVNTDSHTRRLANTKTAEPVRETLQLGVKVRAVINRD